MTITDEVWAAAGGADRLSRRDRTWIGFAAVVTLVVVTLAALVPAAGLTGDRMGVELATVSIHANTHEYEIGVRIMNSGWFDEHDVRLGVDENAQHVVEAAPAVTVAAGGSSLVSLTVHVDDCAAALDSDILLTLRLTRPWGTLASEHPTPFVFGYTPASLDEVDRFMNGAAAQACGRT